MIWAVVVAGGQGARMGGPVPKQYMTLGGEPVLARSLRALCRFRELCGVVVVVPARDVESVKSEILPRLEGLPEIQVVEGGPERRDSVRNGLLALTRASPSDIVMIHDAVRPFVPHEKLPELCRAAVGGGAILATKCRDTVKSVEAGKITGTLDRNALWLAQTPQAFPYGLILDAHKRALAENISVTDDASLIEHFGGQPKIVESGHTNMKLTAPEDMKTARALAGEIPLRVGHGYDAHRLVPDRKLILGGVEIDHPTGLLGHSDADVLIHAIADALMGAAGLGDIGRHFPDTDPRYKGADSLKLLAETAAMVKSLGGRVVNVDATLMAQKPKILPHAPKMRENVANALGIAPAAVNIKATTTEKMGFVGREEGMAAEAVALVSFDL